MNNQDILGIFAPKLNEQQLGQLSFITRLVDAGDKEFEKILKSLHEIYSSKFNIPLTDANEVKRFYNMDDIGIVGPYGSEFGRVR